MDSRINHHWLLPRAGSSNLLIHLEEVTITLCNSLLTESLDSILEIKEYCESGLIDTETCIASLLCCTRSHVTRNKVSECRVTALEIIISILLWDL